MYVFSPFKRGFKDVYIYTHFKTYTLLKIKYIIWDVYRPDITTPVDSV